MAESAVDVFGDVWAEAFGEVFVGEVAEPPNAPGLEYTLSISRMHYRPSESRAHYPVGVGRLHYRLPDEDQ